MKSVLLKGPRNLELCNVPEPAYKDGFVLMKVTRCGICGSDIHYWNVGQPENLVMGHEFCGTVIDPGARSDLKEGDRITGLPISPCGECEACLSNNPQYCPDTWNDAVGISLTNSGAYAAKTAVRSDLVFKVPDSVSDEEAAMVEPMAVGLHAVNIAGIKKGDNVLIIGGGIIGQLSALLAKIKGASYVAMAEVNKLRGKKAVKLGCVDEFYNAKEGGFLQNVRSNNPYGFDVVLDCCGNSACVTNAIMCAKPNGVVTLVGVSLESITIPSALVVTKELIVLGAIAYTKEEFKECLDMIVDKKINLLPFISGIVGLDKVQQAFENLTSENSDAIKILIDPQK